MEHDLDLLEQRLLELGQEELSLENRIRELQVLARDAGREGRFEASDAAWELCEKLRIVMTELLTEIRQIERILYPARLRKRQP